MQCLCEKCGKMRPDIVCSLWIWSITYKSVTVNVSLSWISAHLLWPNLLSMLKDCNGESQQNSDPWRDLPLSGDQTGERLLAYPFVREEKDFLGTTKRTGLASNGFQRCGPIRSLALFYFAVYIQLSVLGWAQLAGVIQVRLEWTRTFLQEVPGWPRLGRHLEPWLRGRYTIGIRRPKCDSQNIFSRLEWHSGRKCRSDKIGKGGEDDTVFHKEGKCNGGRDQNCKLGNFLFPSCWFPISQSHSFRVGQ